MTLTDSKTRNLKPKEKPYRVTDAQSLYVQVTPSGGKHWRFNFTYQGKQKTLALGSYPAVSLLAARMARDNAKILLQQGIDPSASKHAKAQPVGSPTETFGAVAVRWFRLNEAKWVTTYSVRLRARLDQDAMPVMLNGME